MNKFIGLTLAALALAASTSAHAVLVNYGAIGNQNAASIVAGGTTVTGSANVVSSDSFSTSTNGGLGIVGGGADETLDLGETMDIAFGGLVENVFLTATDISPPGNVDYGIEAFVGAASLGVFALPAHTVVTETNNLSSLVGAAFDRIRIASTVSAPLGLVIETVRFTRVPEPTTLALAGLALFGLGMRKRV